MDYLILNEESLPFASQTDCDNNLPHFLKIVAAAFDNRIGAVRVSSLYDMGWYEVQLTENYYMRNWLEKQDRTCHIRVKSLIDKTCCPQIPENDHVSLEQFELSDFILPETNNPMPSLGAAVILDKIAVSFKSAVFWEQAEINLVQIQLQENEEITERPCIAKSCSTIEHWELHFKGIEEQRKLNCRKGQDFWDKRKIEFPNLIFCEQSRKNFYNLSISNAVFDSLWKNLKLLSDNIESCSSDTQLKKLTSLDFSDESSSVKNNPKLSRYRIFTLPDSSRKFFGLHIKNFPGAFRLHFLPDYQNNCVYIGYFGKHLPTARNR